MDGAAGGEPLEVRIARVAARQHGVVTRGQLREAGLTRDAIDERVRTGRLRVLHRGVYMPWPLVGALTPPRHREMAAILACGRGAVVSHESASSLWDITRPAGATAAVEVTLVGGQCRRPGIRAHRVHELAEEDIATVDAIPATAPARTIVDLAARLRPRALEQAVARAGRLELTDADELSATLDRLGRRRGAGRLRAIIGGSGVALTRSAAEERLLALVRRGGLPAPAVNAPLGPYEVDFLWRDAGVALEVDGFAYHSSRRSFERDRRRDVELAAGGVQVLRVTWRQLADEPHAVLVRLARTLALAESRSSRIQTF